MDAKLIRIRELIDQKESIDAELASLIGGMPDAPRRGRPKKSDNNHSAAGPGLAQAPGGEAADA
ncbi:hypothetical protein DW352_14255 [Pseudolabrys taiwanensis]|uniref:Uncharacterized protein n=1 Tax=Pseudolabrys taiwanensis TaxID=331696 RepID=A0A345ZXD1_9HYPH|nr:hypothetical protein [Pseudolabrys taiwanensis]AXK81578.1 hypothetical protein DW352_14255 [Pseudolabrys taiwanensis]